jgi:UDP-N-acetylmuramate: L-alanyl-gamma-D-glutamyl-meso-diaminopimelate ligase
MKVHLIAIGGSIMHNLAIALYGKGFQVTGSDDELFEPSKSRLAACNLLPSDTNWHPEKITPDLDAVITGMHARVDNPELQRARELSLRIYSFPEYFYEQTKDKRRIVISGSHGKTTITSMVMHVMKSLAIPFDYLVGSQVRGFETMVNLDPSSRFAVFEGDEYLASPIDQRPKFHLYHPHIALITGIAWDHFNVFPTFEGYVEQFRIFTGLIEPAGSLVYCSEDPLVRSLGQSTRADIRSIPYQTLGFSVQKNTCFLKAVEKDIPLRIFGAHNLQNLAGAWEVCREVGISDDLFLSAISSFEGAARRLELVRQSESTSIFQDFAHAPSKVRATVNAVKTFFPGRKLIACLELHTFSSLNKAFIGNYAGTLDECDLAVVYFNPLTLEHKHLESLSMDEVKQAFNRSELVVLNDALALRNYLETSSWYNTNLLLMSSGNFGGMDIPALAASIIRNP